jgi:hypothetical protein
MKQLFDMLMYRWETNACWIGLPKTPFWGSFQSGSCCCKGNNVVVSDEFKSEEIYLAAETNRAERE